MGCRLQQRRMVVKLRIGLTVVEVEGSAGSCRVTGRGSHVEAVLRATVNPSNNSWDCGDVVVLFSVNGLVGSKLRPGGHWDPRCSFWSALSSIIYVHNYFDPLSK